MAEGAKDIQRESDSIHSEKVQKGLTRRQFLAGSGAAIVFGILARYGFDKQLRSSSKNSGEIIDPNSSIEKKHKTEAIVEVFENNAQSVKETVDRMKVGITKNPSYGDMMWVVQKNRDKIAQAAKKFDIPEDVALGIVLIENGGGDDLESPAGARGPCQLMRETGKRYNIVDEEKGIDLRADPNYCFEAMCNYLSDMRNLFGGNLGLAVWGYHAGEGNVGSALQEYFKDKKQVDIGDLGEALLDDKLYAQITSNFSKYIKESNLNVHELLSNEKVKENIIVANALSDETELYPYKAVAGAELYRAQNP